jgi:hypothetical protein
MPVAAKTGSRKAKNPPLKTRIVAKIRAIFLGLPGLIKIKSEC